MLGYKENRELSWLKFNDRVLDQAKEKQVPLGEQFSFVSIFQSNLDEFFMVRIGSLYDQMLFYPTLKDTKTNMTAEEQLKACLKRVRVLSKKKDRVYDKLMLEASKYGYQVLKIEDVKKKKNIEYLHKYFKQELLPLLSPSVVSKRQPFPFLNNKELYIVAELESKKGNRKMGIVRCQNAINERLIQLPTEENKYVLVEDIILYYLNELFIKYNVKHKAFMRITRSADIDDEDDSLAGHKDYRELMESLIKQRRRLSPVRLELSEGLEDLEISMLEKFLNLEPSQVFINHVPLDLKFLSEFRDALKKTHPELFYKPLTPMNSPDVVVATPMIKQIAKKDIFLSYPFESMAPFLRLLDEASRDVSVVSIKMTLYRVAKQSKIVESLIQAAENGKEVTVLVELRARFDEENNIDWSKRLEKAGCNVIYGLNGLKVHSKLCLITYTDEKDNIKYISQVGTGNYNEVTSRLYTDMSLMTANQDIGTDINDVFNALCQGVTVEDTHNMLIAPNAMLNKICDMIDVQIALAKEGKEAYVGFKCNSVSSKKMIEKLSEASQAGVKVDLIVRGICCIVPGIKGYTENITVRSIVGRYLEHSRIYIFGKKDPKVYISSADLMTRNLERRVEAAVPIYDKKVKQRILFTFNTILKDNVKASLLLNDGTYKRVKNKEPKLNSQEYFFKHQK